MNRTDKNEKKNGIKLTIALPYKRPAPKSGEEVLTDAALSANYIEYAVENVHPNGLEGQLRRTYRRMLRNLDDAVAKGAKSIELLPDEKDLLRKSFRDCKVPAGLVRYFSILEEEVERATETR